MATQIERAMTGTFGARAKDVVHTGFTNDGMIVTWLGSVDDEPIVAEGWDHIELLGATDTMRRDYYERTKGDQ